MSESVLLRALHAEPADHTARLALADWLEEQGRDGQAELTRLHVRQLQGVGTLKELNRINALLRGGDLPVVPEVSNALGMRFALIPAGSFHTKMGRGITLTRPFYLGIHEVTQQQFRAIMGTNPSYFNARRAVCKGQPTGRFPVDQVTWVEAVEFCRRLTERDRGRVYRLPSEAEWERGCRAGAAHLQTFHTGKTLGPLANYQGSYGGRKWPYLERTSPVGDYPPNAFGLYDMHGNVWEWCSDWFDVRQADGTDPAGPERGTERTVRGGCWKGIAEACWTGYRIGNDPDERSYHEGFRVALDWPAGGDT